MIPLTQWAVPSDERKHDRKHVEQTDAICSWMLYNLPVCCLVGTTADGHRLQQSCQEAVGSSLPSISVVGSEPTTCTIVEQSIAQLRHSRDASLVLVSP